MTIATLNNKLDEVLRELKDIRVILDGLMQPLVAADDRAPLDPTGRRPGAIIRRHLGKPKP